MISVFVNDRKIKVASNTTILSACEAAGIMVPRFCYHSGLPISGNCRMCMVEVEGKSKLIASCLTEVSDNMKIYTNTEKVKHVRSSIMELLLINHPLDCPICDQGGECDLQDQAVKYGSLNSNYKETKRAVSNKYMGSMITTHMTRCIHCSRCIRFIDDIAGTGEIIMINRGEKTEVTTLDEPIKSEISGNIIDICPVGALTATVYRFSYRPWELSYSNTIDVMDAVGSNIRVEYKENEIVRILPRPNGDINDEWIGDKTRFAFDGLSTNRLTNSYINNGTTLEVVDFERALNLIINKINTTPSKKIAAISGDMVDCESMFLLKKIMLGMGCKNFDCRQDSSLMGGSRCHYIANTSLPEMEGADLILIIACNPRFEAPMLNYRLRKAYVSNDAKIFTIGCVANLNYKTTSIGNSPGIIDSIFAGKHELFQMMKNAKKPLMIIGGGVFTRSDAKIFLFKLTKIAECTGVVKDNWNGFNVLQTAASRVGGLDIGFVPIDDGKNTDSIMNSEIETLFLLGVDEVDVSSLGSTFVIYQGSHKDNGFHRANVAIPSSVYTEKNATYVNVTGFVQHSSKIIIPPNGVLDDCEILLKIANGLLGAKLAYANVDDVREAMYNEVAWDNNANQWALAPEVTGSLNYLEPINNHNFNFCSQDPISRSSKNMLLYRNLVS
ncbi:NADH-quinone oxidoreductase subunit G [Candidatus Xenohaliotis californiensis]|uniref:NADH-quinone oxidoreductase n=1 Tax=Candidatus Xenohaliotis californiensis TaxID=84677 RepID=A0ABP0ESU6_9RICK|nr:NADH-quinone oxidoreductase subunit G [Candidatus Xenohaliotis californiensis]